MSVSLLAMLATIAAQALTAATTVTLTSSANPATFGQPVILTATVNPPGAGKVTFYDGTTVLGIGAVSGSTASVTTTLLPSGARSLRAYYAGSPAATSATLTQTIVPVGVTTFGDGVTWNMGRYPYAVVIGDFNGDGKQDVATLNDQHDSVSVFLGNGDGTFRPTMDYPLSSLPSAIVVGDFNGDGRPDIAITRNNTSATTLGILLGNGDGTFQAEVSFNAGPNVSSVAMGDFNGDGKIDLALAADSSNNDAMRVMLGNGDGTFQPPVMYAGGSTLYSVAVGDLNQDGKADLAFGSRNGPLYVLLGNGDGTFGSAITSPAAGHQFGLVIADFNHDGKPDIVATSYDSSLENILLLLGNGDGTLQSPLIVATGSVIGNPVVADFDGDGNLDVLLGAETPDRSRFTIAVLLGNGKGSLANPVYYPVNGFCTTLVAGDFNRDGKVDIFTGGAGSGKASLLLGGATPDLTVSIDHGNGFVAGQAGGTYKLVVTSVGTNTFSGQVTITDALPTGFTATAISGSGWNCTLATLTCQRSDSLAVFSSYPPIRIGVTAGSQAGTATTVATVSSSGDLNSSNNSASDTALVRTSTSVSLAVSPSTGPPRAPRSL